MIQAVSADYLRTLGIPLRQGRMLTEREINALDRVAVVNEAATRFWPAGESPIGRRISLDELAGRFSSAPTNTHITVIGVIGSARNDDLRNEPQPAVLVPYTLLAPPQRMLAVRTQADAAAMMNALRAQVREMDPEQPVNGPMTFKEILGTRTAQPRFIMALFSLFAALGLALALAGIYSVLSYLVAMRTREIGVRVAIGAQRADVLRLICGAGARLVIAGLIVGAFLAAGTARYLGSQVSLFQTSTLDPLSYGAVILLLSAVTFLACLIPAWRASKVDPMAALRYE